MYYKLKNVIAIISLILIVTNSSPLVFAQDSNLDIGHSQSNSTSYPTYYQDKASIVPSIFNENPKTIKYDSLSLSTVLIICGVIFGSLGCGVGYYVTSRDSDCLLEQTYFITANPRLRFR